MSGWNPQANEVFLKALEVQTPERRRKLLDEVCAGDAELRAQVESLLAASERAGSFLQSPPPGLDSSEAKTADIEWPVLEGEGTLIGRYKLLQQIGEGGMGVVFMAEQTHPVKRIVALKIIKPGMDSRLVIARFEAERQALALMEHPNIAKVLDAGTTDSGRPYFVMELVKGIPITRYCDEHHLTPRQRLELFVPVCHAVQHAHQKGIIHRDLKPSNILIALYDGKPVPKVIDFGVAKAAGPKLTERTMFTGFGSIIGTLEYMSPEQAELNQLDVDTRSDIYSLGVLLYELLTGTTPLEHKRLKEGALHELLRIIREEEPPKPSTRLSTSEQMPSIAANRGLEPAKLSGIVRGELDWIVMKALEKDRNRRYETANGLAMDVQRHLNDEAVHACPPSARYRFRKFARRNKAALVMATVVTVGLVLLVVSLTVSNVLITRQSRATAIALKEKDEALAAAKASEAAAKASEATAKAQKKKALAEGQRATSYFLNVRIAVDQMISRLEKSELAQSPQTEKLRKALVQDLLKCYQQLLAKERGTEPAELYETARTYRMTGDLHGMLGQRDKAEADLRRGIAILDKLTTDFFSNPDYWHVLATSNASLGHVLQDAGRVPEAETAFRHALSIWAALTIRFPTHGLYRTSVTNCHDDLFRLLKDNDRPQEAEQAYRQILVPFEKELFEAPTHLRKQMALADACCLVSQLLRNLGRADEAVKTDDRALVLYKNLKSDSARTAEDRTELGRCQVSMANILVSLGRVKEAEAAIREGIRLAPVLGSSHHALGLLLMNHRRWPEAEAEYREEVRLTPKSVSARAGLGHALQEQAKWADAEAEFREEIRLDPTARGAHRELGDALREQGKTSEAEAAYREALRVRPDDANARHYLTVLRRPVEIAAVRDEIRNQPNSAELHVKLAILLAHPGTTDEAIAEYQKAIELKPDLVKAHSNLAQLLGLSGRAEEAIAEYRIAVALKSDDAESFYRLGSLLFTQDKPDEAIPAYRKAIEIKPDYAVAHFDLGKLLVRQGKFTEALPYLKRGYELGSRNPDWQRQSDAQWIRACEKLIEVDARLTRVLAGEASVADAAERISFARVCYYKRQFDLATRFYEEAFTEKRELSDDMSSGFRQIAARSAALAGSGEGEDAKSLDEPQRARRRRQALAWLISDLQRCEPRLQDAPDAVRQMIEQSLQHWLSDRDLKGVRDDAYLTKLPPDERESWMRFWTEVRKLLAEQSALRARSATTQRAAATQATTSKSN